MPALDTPESTAATTPDHRTETIGELCSLTLSELRSVIGMLPVSLRDVAEYQFGWKDEKGRPTEGSSGKLIRPAIALLCARAAGGRAEQAVPAAVAVELVHSFSVVHDDVMDGDATRRHRPTVWSAFGATDAVLVGDAFLALAFRVIAALQPASYAVFSDALLDMVRGQAMDLAFEKTTAVTLADGLEMAAGKTGSLLRCACQLGALSADADDERAMRFGEFGANLGLAFQITDDLLGIWGDPAVTGKPVHSDLRARKKSLPVLAALTSGTAAGDRFALRYARDPALPFAPDEYDELAALIKEAGGRAWAEHRARQAYADARTALRRARPEPGPAADLLALADTLTSRQH